MSRRPELAHDFEMGKCADPKCTAAHVQLYDDEGECFAVMTIAVDSIPKVVAWLQAHAYAMTAGRDK